MMHHQVRLNLLERVKNNTYENQQGCTTEELREFLGYTKDASETWENGYKCQEDRTWKCNARHDLVKELSGLLARLDTRDEAVLRLDCIRHLLRIHRNGRIEIGKDDDQDCKYKVIGERCIVEEARQYNVHL